MIMAFTDTIKNMLPWQRQIAKLKNDISVLASSRPLSAIMGSTGRSFVIPQYNLPLPQIEQLSKTSDILRICHNAIRQEIFRNGFELLEIHKTDEDVLEEFDYDVNSEEYKQAALEERRRIVPFLNTCNQNAQGILKVSQMLEDDVNIFDDQYSLFIFDYAYDSTGNEVVEMRDLQEWIRADPKSMAKVMNSQDIPGMTDNNTFLMSCPANRTELHEIPAAPDGSVPEVYCPKSGQRLWRVWYRHKSLNGKDVYYFEHEVHYENRYFPSTRLGYSPVIAVLEKVLALQAQDRYVNDSYNRGQMPNGIIFAKTANHKSFWDAFKQMLFNAKENPHVPRAMGVHVPSGQGDGGKFIEYVDLMRSLEEMQFTPFRDEVRKVVGAVYGVSPVFQNDTSTSGGLNNEGLQITVTNRSSETKQATYNEGHYRKLMKALGAKYHILRLKPSEEQDDMARLQRIEQGFKNAELALKFGLTAEYDEDKGEVVVYGGQLTKPEPVNPFSDSNSPNSIPAITGDSTRGDDDEDGSPDSSTRSDGEPDSPRSVEKSSPVALSSRNRVSSSISPPKYTSTSLVKKSSDFLKAFKQLINKYVGKDKSLSEDSLKTMREEVNVFLSRELRAIALSQMLQVYRDTIDDVERELDLNILFNQRDENALSFLQNQSVLENSFVDLTRDVSSRIDEIIVDAYQNPEGLSTQKLEERIREVSGLARSRAETIARTETSKVSAAARKVSYDKAQELRDETFLYEWIGPDDSRTTAASKEIKSRTKGGVTWEELVSIVQDVSAKYFPDWVVDPRAPVSHYNSRHTFIRVQSR